MSTPPTTTTITDRLFSVSGKNVLVTGGSRGIGLMIAKGFVSAGANVLLTSRDANACREASESILQNSNNATTGRCFHVPSNLSTQDGCSDLARHTSEIFNGKLDVLINNAGTSWGEDPSYDNNKSSRSGWGWDKVLNLNVKGMFYLTRECVPLLRRIPPSPVDDNDEGETRKPVAVTDPGRIINIGSIAGLVPQGAPTHAYDVSKAAVHHLTKKLSTDLSSMGITVNCVAPGYVPSRMSAGLASYGADEESIARGIPMGRMGEEDDMVGACFYFGGKAGAWCTGVILNVDGGMIGANSIDLISNL